MLYDAPTLFEAGADDFCDKIIAVLAPHDTRVARIIERDGLSNEAARARIDAQPNDAFYREKCDFIVSLPMKGKINSLNASVAAGILMYEAASHR